MCPWFRGRPAPKWGHVRYSVFTVLRDRVERRIEELHEASLHTAPTDFVFCYEDGKSPSFTWWKKRFECAMERFGVDHKARQLSPHSLRHTLASLLSGGLLRQFMDHRNEEMMALYSRPHMLDRIRAYQVQREKVERFWNSGDKAQYSLRRGCR